MTVILLAALLALPPPKPAPPPSQVQAAPELSDADVQSRIKALLGNIDSRIGADQWKALGPRGAALLQPIALDPEELPTRRAKAAYGLSIVSPDQAEPVLTRLAQDEAQPTTLRIAAMRGMARVASPDVAAQKVSKVLRTARDPGVRGAAAEVVAASGTDGCAQVKAQLDREDPVQRPAFRRALARCGE
jgi:hypothetical protein